MPFRTPVPLSAANDFAKAERYGLLLPPKSNDCTELKPVSRWSGGQPSRAYGSTRPSAMTGSFTISTGTSARRSTKYLAQSSDNELLKAFIRSHMGEPKSDALVQTVYLDGTDFALCNQRMRGDERSPLVRLRWYGASAVNQVSVERTTLRETQTEDSSCSKQRFTIPSSELKSLLDFQLDPDCVGRAGLLEREVAEITNQIEHNGLRSKIRTQKRRTEWSDDKRKGWTVTLDECVCYFRDTALGSATSPLDPRASDCNDCWVFPFAILDVKGNKGRGMDQHTAALPQWVTELAAAKMLLEVPQYCEYLTATAWLFGHPHVREVPEFMDILLSQTVELVEQGKLQPSAPMQPAHAQEDAKITYPVEPRLFMATERTFIKWLQVSTMFLLIPLLLEKFNKWNDSQDLSDVHKDVHKVADYLMLVGGMVVIAFAFFVYCKRLNMLTTKAVGDWYEIKAVIAITVVIVSIHVFTLFDKIEGE